VALLSFSGNSDISIHLLLGSDGEWTRCDDIWIRPSEAENFLETLDFTVDGTAPLVMVFKLAIGIDGIIRYKILFLVYI